LKSLGLNIGPFDFQSLSVMCESNIFTSDVNKDFSHKDQDQVTDLLNKDQTFIVKNQEKNKDFTVKDKDQDQDLSLKDRSRTVDSV